MNDMTSVRCTNCGAVLLAGAEACARCGTPRSEAAPTAERRAGGGSPAVLGGALVLGLAAVAVAAVAWRGAIQRDGVAAVAPRPSAQPRAQPSAAHTTAATVTARSPAPPASAAQPNASASDGAEAGGSLPREVIQRVVRQNNPRFRLCYEQGLAREPQLTGRVLVRFVIGPDGSVSSATDAGSTLPDATVVECVRRRFSTLTFPPPAGGQVSVVYPIRFAPG